MLYNGILGRIRVFKGEIQVAEIWDAQQDLFEALEFISGMPGENFPDEEHVSRFTMGLYCEDYYPLTIDVSVENEYRGKEITRA